jgi:hypothetical protein
MAVGVLQKYFYIVLTAQVLLSLINSLFTLTDNGAVIAIFGFFGAHRSSKYSLLAYILFAAVSTVVDIVRVLLWANYIMSKTLPYYSALGNYYIMMLCFGMAIKIIGCIFSFFIQKSMVSRIGGARERTNKVSKHFI